MSLTSGLVALCLLLAGMTVIGPTPQLGRGQPFLPRDARCGRGVGVVGQKLRRLFSPTWFMGGWRLGGANHQGQRQLSQYIVFLEQCASLLRAGRTLSTVWKDLRADQSQIPELRALATYAGAWANAGWDVARALTHFASSGTVTGVLGQRIGELGAVLAVAERSGVPVASVLDALAEHLERDVELAAALSRSLASPKATSTLLTWLPLLGGVMGVISSVDLSRSLTSPLGVPALVGGLSYGSPDGYGPGG